ncbi:putative reverse transcriptase domain-containing protein [Tanacetum coccineum]
MDKSWMETNRISKSYVDGVAAFTDYAVHNLQKMGNIDPRVNKKHIYIPCLCTKCLNHIEHKVEEVKYHLYRRGIDISYTKWTKHREEDEASISAPKPVNATTEFVDDMDFAYIPTDGHTTVEMVNATKVNFDVDDRVKFQELLLDVEKPLYKGCPDFTKLSAIVKLLNLKGKYGASDKFFTELLGLIKKMLPAGNEMVEKTYQAKKVMRLMGLGLKKIHAWRTIDEKFPKITEDIRNLRLGISADGVDINTGNRHHNVWPVLTVIYNLPPWLCMKRKFINLLVLISGYPRNDIDVFLEPLVDDLHTLFETGVDTYNASTKDNFNLCAVVLWIINDYPALSTLYGCPYSGFKGCVVCGKDTNCVRLSALSNQKKNVAESIVGTLLHVPGKTKDGLKARLDLAELGVKPELFAMQDEDKTTLRPAGYTLTNAEKDIFCETLHNIKVPEGYCSNFSSLVNLKDRKLIGLKSHDYHMLMQEFLPIAIRSIMHPPTRYAIIRFCFFFKSICSKEIILKELDKMQAELVVTLLLKDCGESKINQREILAEETIAERTIAFI